MAPVERAFAAGCSVMMRWRRGRRDSVSSTSAGVEASRWADGDEGVGTEYSFSAFTADPRICCL